MYSEKSRSQVWLLYSIWQTLNSARRNMNKPCSPGELRSQIDSIWNAFWSGGVSNPLEVMEQITYLLFLRRLDDLNTLEEPFKVASASQRYYG